MGTDWDGTDEDKARVVAEADHIHALEAGTEAAHEAARAMLYQEAEDRYGEHLAVAECAALLCQEGLTAGRAALAATSLHLIGRKLLLAFERACNQGDDDGPARKRATKRIELLGLPGHVFVTFQSDPRGWPLIVQSARTLREVRVGGRS